MTTRAAAPKAASSAVPAAAPRIESAALLTVPPFEFDPEFELLLLLLLDDDPEEGEDDGTATTDVALAVAAPAALVAAVGCEWSVGAFTTGPAHLAELPQSGWPEERSGGQQYG